MNNQYNLGGVSADVTFGKRGGHVQFDKLNDLFKITAADGASLTRVKILDAVENDEATTLGQVNSLITAATGSLGTMSTQDADAVAITGGAIDGTVIGGTTAAAGTFTTLDADSFSTDTISEKTADAGVTVDGVLLKDGGINASGDVTISGNLTVLGDTTSLNVATLEVEDNMITLNKGESGAGVTAGTAGIEVDRGTEQMAQWYWDEVADAWVAKYADGSLAKIQGDIDVIVGREDGGFGVDISGYADDSLIFANGTEFAKGLEHQVVTTTATGVEYTYVDALRRQSDGKAVITTDQAVSVDGEYLEIKTEVGAVHVTAKNEAGTGDVDLYLQGQGNGDVIIAANQSAESLIIGQDDTTLTVSGGTSVAGDAGDLIIKGGDGSSTFNSGDVVLQGGTGGASEGIVIIRDSAGNEVASFTGGTASAVDYVDFVNGVGETTIQSVGDSADVNLVLKAKGAGYVVAPAGYDLSAAPDEAFVTKGYVDTAVTAAVENNTDPLVKRATFTADSVATGFDIGTLANVAGKEYYVSRITLHVATEVSGAGVESMVVSDGVAVLATADESDVLADTYIIDLPFVTASAGGSTFSVEFQNAGATAVAPTAGSVTAVVEYKVV